MWRPFPALGFCRWCIVIHGVHWTSPRFDYLFDTRKKWTLEEISPYVCDLTTDKLDVGALLTKYSRASMHNGVKVFSSRRTTA